MQTDPVFQGKIPLEGNLTVEKTVVNTVDGNEVNMLEYSGSVNAHAPLTVVNTRGFDLPETGDNGTMVFTIVGILAMAGAAAAIILVFKKGKKENAA